MHLDAIYRYPVKGLGAETLGRTVLKPGDGIPGDRAIAVAHGASAFDPDNPGWVKRRNFLSVAQTPMLATARLSREGAALRVTMPGRADMAVPDTPEGRAALAEWMGETPEARDGPYRVAAVPGQALTDVDYPSISLHAVATLDALGAAMGIAPDRRRFRGNLWIEGAEAWAEHDWVGREITIGTARLRGVEPVTRCKAIIANPETGTRDAELVDMLRTLRGEAHFGLYAQVIEPGEIAPGDSISIVGAP